MRRRHRANRVHRRARGRRRRSRRRSRIRGRRTHGLRRCLGDRARGRRRWRRPWRRCGRRRRWWGRCRHRAGRSGWRGRYAPALDAQLGEQPRKPLVRNFADRVCQSQHGPGRRWPSQSEGPLQPHDAGGQRDLRIGGGRMCPQFRGHLRLHGDHEDVYFLAAFRAVIGKHPSEPLARSENALAIVGHQVAKRNSRPVVHHLLMNDSSSACLGPRIPLPIRPGAPHVILSPDVQSPA